MAHISYQLYSSRNFLPLENIFKMVAQHGCTQVEGVSFFMLADTAQATKNRIAHYPAVTNTICFNNAFCTHWYCRFANTVVMMLFTWQRH